MSCKLEPAIWSHDTAQRILCFDRCQLIITWMSNIKEVHGKARVHILSTYYLEYGRHVARLRRRRRCRRAYAPTNNTASHDNHEKINSWVSFSFRSEYGAPLGGPSGRRSSAISCMPWIFFLVWLLVHGPDPLRCTTQRDQLRVWQIWS